MKYPTITQTWKLTAIAGLTLAISFGARAESKDIVDTAVEAGSFNTLVTAVKAAGLVDALKSDGPFTVFAPTDDAFAKLPEGLVAALLDQPDKLSAILLYHVVPGKVMAKDAVKLSSAGTLLGQNAAIDTRDGVMIAGAKVITTDIAASNGVIHVIDSVMLPKDLVDVAASNDQFSTLVAAVKAAGLVDTLKGDGPFTVFAPTNDAFAKLPAGTVEDLLKPENKDKLIAVLTYHVIPGRVPAADVASLTSVDSVQGSPISVYTARNEDGSITGVKVSGANVTMTDIGALNGVIHVIDSVILPK